MGRTSHASCVACPARPFYQWSAARHAERLSACPVARVLPGMRSQSSPALAMRDRSVMLVWLLSFAVCDLAANLGAQGSASTGAASSRVTLDDSHLHLTNYVQKGITLRDML